MARIAPSGHQVFPDETFLRQHAIMHALAERTDVPMARVHWLETDPSWFGQSFWIMDRVEGDIPTDTPPYAGQGWLHDATPAQQAQAWDAGIDAMAGIHRVDLDRLGLPAGTYPDADDTLAWHLDDLERFSPGPRRAPRTGWRGGRSAGCAATGRPNRPRGRAWCGATPASAT